MSLEIMRKAVWVDAAHFQNCSLNAIMLPFQGPISRLSVTLQLGILRIRTSFGHHILNTPKQSVRNLYPWPLPTSVSDSCRHAIFHTLGQDHSLLGTTLPGSCSRHTQAALVCSAPLGPQRYHLVSSFSLRSSLASTFLSLLATGLIISSKANCFLF